MTQDPPFLTVRQATERLAESGLSVSKDTVQRWCRDSEIPALKLPGGQYRIRVEDVDALLTPVSAEAPAGAA